MKTRFVLAALVVVSLAVAGSLKAAIENAAALKCPVSGKPVNPDSTVDFNGGKVAFCCDNCPKEFAKNTDKYAAKANLQLAQSNQLKQTKCPLTGKAINPEMAVDVDGVHVGLCCKNCKAKLEGASHDDQVNLVFKDTSKGFETVKK
jgi:hypothetical protein